MQLTTTQDQSALHLVWLIWTFLLRSNWDPFVNVYILVTLFTIISIAMINKKTISFYCIVVVSLFCVLEWMFLSLVSMVSEAWFTGSYVIVGQFQWFIKNGYMFTKGWIKRFLQLVWIINVLLLEGYKGLYPSWFLWYYIQYIIG